MRTTLYLAGPLFGLADQAHNLKLATELQMLGYKVILPQMYNFGTLGETVSQCYADAYEADVMVANIDGTDADSGTALEVGYRGLDKLTILYRTDFRTQVDQELGMNGMFKRFPLVYAPIADIAIDVDKAYRNLANLIHEEVERLL